MANDNADPANLFWWVLCVAAFLAGTVVGYYPGERAGRSEAAREIAEHYGSVDRHVEAWVRERFEVSDDER